LVDPGLARQRNELVADALAESETKQQLRKQKARHVLGSNDPLVCPMLNFVGIRPRDECKLDSLSCSIAASLSATGSGSRRRAGRNSARACGSAAFGWRQWLALVIA
jgi:hypothetical protein